MTTIRTFTPGPESTFKSEVTITTADSKHTMTDASGRTSPLNNAGLERIARYMIETTQEVPAMTTQQEDMIRDMSILKRNLAALLEDADRLSGMKSLDKEESRQVFAVIRAIGAAYTTTGEARDAITDHYCA